MADRRPSSGLPDEASAKSGRAVDRLFNIEQKKFRNRYTISRENSMPKKLYLNTFKALIQTDLAIFKQLILDKFIDVSIWVILTITVTSYILPFFGLSATFGVFQLGGVLAAVGLFEVYGSTVELVSDYEGDRIINYNLTLPIPAWLVIFSKAAAYFLLYLTLTILIFPVGKLCLWHQLDLATINYPQFLLVLFFASLFFASFVVWVSSITLNMSKLGTVWSRFIFPMWFLGGFQFSWLAMRNTIPALAYFNLINPMLYLTEAIRTALLGQASFINFWLCLLAVVGFSAICFAAGYRNLKKRLDFV